MEVITLEHKQMVKEAIATLDDNLEVNITIISSEHEEIHTNKLILSLFCTVLSPLLSSPCCTSQTLFLPDFSTSTIKNIINLFTNGFIQGDSSSNSDIDGIIDVGKLLFVENFVLTEGEKTVEPEKNRGFQS